MVVTNVINQPTDVVVELNTIVKIHKYKKFHEGHHFIPMEVHGTLGHDMDHFIKECACLFHDRWSSVIYPCLFTFSFSSNVLILFFNVL
jgi:hypothetical protein